MTCRIPPTLAEWRVANPTFELFKDSGIDETSQQEILTWYQFRHVCNTDKFGVFFRRSARLYAGQYTNLLRIEAVRYDPMVADYMEREHTRQAQTEGTETSQTSQETSRQTKTDGTTHGTAETTGSGIRDATRKHYLTQDS